VLVQVGLKCERLFALGALKVLRWRVGLHVRSQVRPGTDVLQLFTSVIYECS
jgi:hypothetical protein